MTHPLMKRVIIKPTSSLLPCISVRSISSSSMLICRSNNHINALTPSHYRPSHSNRSPPLHYTCTRSFADAVADATAASSTPQLDRKEIEERVIQVVKKFPKVDESKVTPTATFTQDLGLDSLDVVELVMELEEEFHIEISDQDADRIASIKDAIEFLAKHPQAK